MYEIADKQPFNKFRDYYENVTWLLEKVLIPDPIFWIWKFRSAINNFHEIIAEPNYFIADHNKFHREQIEHMKGEITNEQQ